MTSRVTRVLVTCEHGGNRIPAEYWPLFRKYRATLESHRGYDPGALALARDVASAFGAELVYSTTSRLLVELNRSPRHPKLFSEITRPLPAAERDRVMRRYYWPYREWVEMQARDAIDSGNAVVHISSHSFTPRLNGPERRADIGLLYDPRRQRESELCRAWQRALREENPRLVVRRNYPYRGYDDGLTTHLRRLYPDAAYAGIEVEMNQRYVLSDPSGWRALRKLLVQTLKRLLAERGVD
jgi:predicted N-formylglutamate amidohydrolase